MREGYALNYCNKGTLRIGITEEAQRPAFEALKSYFDEIQMPYGEESDIMHAMWGKFLLNVGINQTCMVYDTTYYGALTIPEAMQDMHDAMHEVIAIAEAEGVNLTEADYEYYVNVLRGLNPDGYPSMRQDALAHRKSEVDIFAGTVLEIAERHGIPTPVNEKYYKLVHEQESQY